MRQRETLRRTERRNYILFGSLIVVVAFLTLTSHEASVQQLVVVGKDLPARHIADHNWTVAPDLANYSFPHGRLELGKAGSHFDPNSIFVSMASYRDDQCMPTIEDIFRKAQRPRSLYVGIVEHRNSGDSTCVPPQFKRGVDGCNSDFCFSDNIRRTEFRGKDARGPTFGRYYGMLMYRGEKYFMMIDSHNRFVTHWDAILVTMYQGLNVPKGVLSHYPEAWHGPGEKETNAPLDTRQTTTYLCTAKFVEHLGFPSLESLVVPRRKECRPQPWASSTFLFASGRLLSEVPFDPNLDYVFDGEEIVYSARMWTHGWDIFSPSQNILYHNDAFSRSNAVHLGIYGLGLPSHRLWSLARDASQRRIQRLLKTVHKGTDRRHVPDDSKEEAVIKDLDKFGLGTARMLDEWYKYAGIDRVHYKLTRNFCQENP